MAYTDILVLKDMLEKGGIPFEFEPLFDGYHICYPRKELYVCSVIEHAYSYGSSDDLLEINGLLTKKEAEYDDVVGYLTAINVFDRIKHHWDKNKVILKEVYNL